MSPSTLIFPFFTTEPFLLSTHQQYQEQYGFTPITTSRRWRQTLNTTWSLSTQTQKPQSWMHSNDLLIPIFPDRMQLSR